MVRSCSKPSKGATHAGGTLEDRARYNSRLTFSPFPFPISTDEQTARLRELGEQLDAHRKRQQALHPRLTLTDMYNVLEKLRAGAELSAKERTIHEQGLVSVLKQIHDDLDAAVFDAYGWPTNLNDEEILERLVALNAERSAEEAQGIVRWLRPEFQNPGDGKQQKGLTLPDDDAIDGEADQEEGQPQGDGSRFRAKTEKTATAKTGNDSRPPRRGAAGGAAASTGASGTKSTGGASGTRGKAPLTPALSHEGRGGKTKATARDWPKTREAQAKAVLAALRDSAGSVTAEELAAMFARSTGKEPLIPGTGQRLETPGERKSTAGRASSGTRGKSTGRASGTQSETIAELVEALATLGQARRLRGGKFAS